MVAKYFERIGDHATNICFLFVFVNRFYFVIAFTNLFVISICVSGLALKK